MRPAALFTSILFAATQASAQTIVDDSIIGNRWVRGLLETFSIYIDDPRSIELRKNSNGIQDGIVCGQMRWRKRDDSGMTNWHLYAVDGTYKKFYFIDIEKPESQRTDDDRATFVKMFRICASSTAPVGPPESRGGK